MLFTSVGVWHHSFVTTAQVKNIFVDDTEMAEIASRPELVKRLQTGSRDARKGHGRFIPAV
jgi:hypothetical protein